MKNKLIYGVGIKDPGYTTRTTSIENGKATRNTCPYYQRWHSMLTRCYSENYHLKFPTYINCSVCEEWLSFANFREWMKLQDWKGKHLDKDVAIPGNKVYSPDACAFISKELNYFLTNRKAMRGKYALGVTCKRGDLFVAECRDPFNKSKSPYLGAYKTEGLAHKAWKDAKHRYALIYADLQNDTRISNSLKTMFVDAETEAEADNAVNQLLSVG